MACTTGSSGNDDGSSTYIEFYEPLHPFVQYVNFNVFTLWRMLKFSAQAHVLFLCTLLTFSWECVDCFFSLLLRSFLNIWCDVLNGPTESFYSVQIRRKEILNFSAGWFLSMEMSAIVVVVVVITVVLTLGHRNCKCNFNLCHFRIQISNGYLKCAKMQIPNGNSKESTSNDGNWLK